MRRSARLSFLLGRAPTLRLSTVLIEQPPLPASERRRQAAEAAPGHYETSEDEVRWAAGSQQLTQNMLNWGVARKLFPAVLCIARPTRSCTRPTPASQSEWEEDNGLWEDQEEEPEPEQQEGPDEEPQEGAEEEQGPGGEQAAEGDGQDAEPAADSVAPAADDAEGTHKVAPAEADDGSGQSGGCCEAAAAQPAVLQQLEEEDESSNTAAQDGGGDEEAAEGAENVPPAAEDLQPRYDAITHSMLKVGAGAKGLMAACD